MMSGFSVWGCELLECSARFSIIRAACSNEPEGITMFRFLFAAAVAILLNLPAASSSAATFVYVSVAGEQVISIWQMDENSGSLTHLSKVEVEGEPGCLTTDPAQKFMFASLRTAGKIASYRIDPATGGLTPVGVISADADPAYLATDRSGRFLMSAYYFAGRVAVHPIGEDGSLDIIGNLRRSAADNLDD